MKSYLILAVLLSSVACSSISDRQEPISPRFNHVYLNSTDIEASITFYQAAFDIIVFNEVKEITRIDASGNRTTSKTHIVLLRFPGQHFNLEIGQQPAFSPNNTGASYTHLGIDVEDIEAASQRLINAGATLLRPIGTVEANDIQAKTAFFTGPNGETLELMQVLEGKF